jgi:plastocyanin
MTQRPRIPHRLRAGFALAAGAIALTACGGSGSSGATIPANVDLTVVAVDGIAWNAKDYAVTTTDGRATIAARNDSSIAHNLHIIASDGVENPVSLDIPGKGDVDSASFALTPGTYTIICKIPGHSNMKATLAVS